MGYASGRLARHGPFSHLYLRMIIMVLASVATTSFTIILFFSLPSCLYLRATPFSSECLAACTSSPYSSDTSPDTDSRSGYCTSTRTFHIMRAPSFSPSSNIVRLLGLRPVLPPQHAAPVHGRSREPTDARRHGYEASRSCSWPFSVRAVEEDIVAPATLRLSWL
ncbi:hypothetical protein Zm00014a_001887 [Zea mays]|uniref:Uncharacterized protein n=1 Tax=Zea mays TaxID=4577 RepID=A0A3L6FJA9_MAIZE|nr:hypothetical protein Zm00014a_001887 [Zea mays]